MVKNLQFSYEKSAKSESAGGNHSSFTSFYGYNLTYVPSYRTKSKITTR